MVHLVPAKSGESSVGPSGRVLLSIGLLLVCLLSPATASASTASVNAGLLSYLAQSGEANNVTVSRSGSVHRVNDAGTVIVPGSGCSAVDPNTVDCVGATSISVSTDDLDDIVLISAPTNATLVGGSGNDTLSGGPEDDVFDGGSGTDTLRGDAGADLLDGGLDADTLSGGADVDTVSFAGRLGDVIADIDNDPDDGESGEGDNIRTDVQNVIGGSGNDVLIGSLGNNTLNGGIGDDSFEGGLGADVFNGGPGTDTLSYETRSAPVTVDTDGEADDGQDTEGDNAQTDVENLIGGSAADTLTGNSGSNLIVGGDGSDVLLGDHGDDSLLGLAGDDTLDGGPGSDALSGGDGIDSVSYATRQAGVVADLDGLGDDGEPGENDAIASDVENLIAGEGNDSLTGDGLANLLVGGGGSDTLLGGDGVDSVFGGPGADSVVSRDAVGDTVDCGSEFDAVLADVLDYVSGCEVVDRGTNAGDGADGTSGPGGGVSGPGGGETEDAVDSILEFPKPMVKVTRTGRIRIPVRCAGRADCRGRLVVKTARRLRLAGKRKSRTFVIRRQTFSWRAGQSARLNIRLQDKLLRHLRRKKGLDLRVTARMEVGPGARSVSGTSRTITGLVRAEPGGV